MEYVISTLLLGMPATFRLSQSTVLGVGWGGVKKVTHHEYCVNALIRHTTAHWKAII